MWLRKSRAIASGLREENRAQRFHGRLQEFVRTPTPKRIASRWKRISRRKKGDTIYIPNYLARPEKMPLERTVILRVRLVHYRKPQEGVCDKDRYTRSARRE